MVGWKTRWQSQMIFPNAGLLFIMQDRCSSPHLCRSKSKWQSPAAEREEEQQKQRTSSSLFIILLCRFAGRGSVWATENGTENGRPGERTAEQLEVSISFSTLISGEKTKCYPVEFKKVNFIPYCIRFLLFTTSPIHEKRAIKLYPTRRFFFSKPQLHQRHERSWFLILVIEQKTLVEWRVGCQAFVSLCYWSSLPPSSPSRHCSLLLLLLL